MMTNAHVISDEKSGRPYSQIRIYLKPGKITGNIKKDTTQKREATLLDYSARLDLALLKIQPSDSLPSYRKLDFADSSRVTIGDPVLAIGHPEQGGLWTLTTGTISSQIENFQDIPGKNVFQTEASINRGNSGGPLIDRNGYMVGVNSMISRIGKDGMVITGINFSIKSEVVINWLNSIGLKFASAIPGEEGNKEKIIAQDVGIVPVPKTESPKPEPEPQQFEGPRILTDPHPYKEKDFYGQVEDEMEDMMKDMKGKIGSQKVPGRGQK
jgi:serine protease Do